ncbi:MAG: hypothetical protein GXO63_01045 [Candidatus Micrarchaeota archaeon]|nr:hypothetical protein [Candidatus Micrarchaeota archaeon]
MSVVDTVRSYRPNLDKKPPSTPEAMYINGLGEKVERIRNQYNVLIETIVDRPPI